MNEHFIRDSVNLLKEKGILFDTGLSDNEIIQVEELFNFHFPPDLKLFLQTGLPISNEFPNWRKALTDITEKDVIIKSLNWPLEGILFDIENNGFWIKDWGIKPNLIEQQIEIAKKQYITYPKLVPVYSHRYIPSAPLEADNPVFSVYQTDIICYGNDLLSYLQHEFNIGLPKGYDLSSQPKQIEFWSLHMDYEGGL